MFRSAPAPAPAPAPTIALAIALSLLVPAVAHAATVSIDVRGADGRPLAGAVVSIEPPRATPAIGRGPYLVEQRDIQFQPRVLIVPVGASVGFPNRDRVRHHVYSFSKPKKFDLKLYGREDARSVTFDRPGVVALGCNIHDTMSGFIFVTATPFAAQTDAVGHVSLRNVPPGGATVRVWHPSIRGPGNSLSQPLSVSAGGSAVGFTIRR